MTKEELMSLDIELEVVLPKTEDVPFNDLEFHNFRVYSRKVDKNIGDLSEEEKEDIIKKTIKEAREKNIYVPKSYEEYETD